MNEFDKLRFYNLCFMKGYTASRLSRATGIPKSNISRLMNGTIKFENITVTNAYKLSICFGMTIEEMYRYIKQI